MRNDILDWLANIPHPLNDVAFQQPDPVEMEKLSNLAQDALGDQVICTFTAVQNSNWNTGSSGTEIQFQLAIYGKRGNKDNALTIAQDFVSVVDNFTGLLPGSSVYVIRITPGPQVDQPDGVILQYTLKAYTQSN